MTFPKKSFIYALRTRLLPWRLRVSGFKFQVSSLQFQVTNFKYQVKILPLPFAFCLTLSPFLRADGAIGAQTSTTIDAQALVRQVETQYQGATSHSIMHMKVITDAYTREMSLEGWSEGRDKFLARILAPKKDEGTATLKIGDEMWNYLPKIDRLMKIPSSLMGDRWMGSHLTNDDLVKENKIDELYTFETGKVENNIATIICTPKPDAAVVWGKVIYRIDLTKKIPVDIQYYDENGELVRTMSFERVERISGRWVPMQMLIRPADKPKEMTELVYDSLEFDIKFDANLFSLQSLRRR